MKKNRADTYFYLSCLLFLLGVIGYVSHENGTKPEEDARLERAFTEAAKQIEGRPATDSIVVNIASLTTFEWDSLVPFGWDNSAVRMQRRLGYEWEGARKLSEGDHMFVFLKGREVVAHVYFEGSNHDKDDLVFVNKLGHNGEVVYTPETAFFLVKKSRASIGLIDIAPVGVPYRVKVPY